MVFAVVFGSLIQPLSAMVFTSSALVGSNARSLSPWMAVSFVVAIIGVLVKRTPNGKQLGGKGDRGSSTSGDSASEMDVEAVLGPIDTPGAQAGAQAGGADNSNVRTPLLRPDHA